MEKILIVYWVPSTEIIRKTGIPNKTHFKYTVNKRNSLINKILGLDYQVMLVKAKDSSTLIMWIDNQKFRQR